ncbi:MAG: DUF5615 family PIN-like protein [Verrucomicrobia bacterium]|nr:DUF5615 family PIN-like protein [Verrucomicrobiota bacterium]
MRFIIDAQLPPALARTLWALGCEAFAVRELGLRDATDGQLWNYALEHGAVTAATAAASLESPEGRLVHQRSYHLSRMNGQEAGAGRRPGPGAARSAAGRYAQGQVRPDHFGNLPPPRATVRGAMRFAGARLAKSPGRIPPARLEERQQSLVRAGPPA